MPLQLNIKCSLTILKQVFLKLLFKINHWVSAHQGVNASRTRVGMRLLFVPAGRSDMPGPGGVGTQPEPRFLPPAGGDTQ